MSSFSLSPSVAVQEVDDTSYVPAASTAGGGFAVSRPVPNCAGAGAAGARTDTNPAADRGAHFQPVEPGPAGFGISRAALQVAAADAFQPRSRVRGNGRRSGRGRSADVGHPPGSPDYSSHTKNLMKEKGEVAKRGGGQDQPQDDQESQRVWRLGLSIEKWHGGHFTRRRAQLPTRDSSYRYCSISPVAGL